MDVHVDKLHAVIGLGKTGLSCIRFLTAKGIPVAVTDNRTHPPCADVLKKEYPNISQHLGKFDANLLKKAHHLVLSPGVSRYQLPIDTCVMNGTRLIGDIELFAQVAQAPIVAITGTNGKSTVTTLVGEMAKFAGREVLVGGNLGVPALELLSLPVPQYYVLELSSFQLETTYSLQPAIATILNISPDHMDRYASFEAYCRTKQRIYQQAKYSVFNRDDHLTKPDTITVATSFGLNNPQAGEFGIKKYKQQNYLCEGDELLLATHALKLTGEQNWGNVLAALAIGKAMQLPMQAMLACLKSFSGLKHRCQWVRKLDGVVWYNDSKATNVGATLAAINGFGSQISGKIILIIGGQSKKAKFTKLCQPIARYVRRLIIFGQDSALLKKTFTGVVPITVAEKLTQVVEYSRIFAQSGDIVLFSPACASFDMFIDFAHRGSAYTELVRGL